jgi:hypothetical protein
MKSTSSQPPREITEEESEQEIEENNNESSESENTKESESDEADGTSDDPSSDENDKEEPKTAKNKGSKNSNSKHVPPPTKVVKKEKLFINVANTRYPIIKEAAKGLGYKVTYKEEKDWDIIWYD